MLGWSGGGANVKAKCDFIFSWTHSKACCLVIDYASNTIRKTNADDARYV